MIPKPDRRCAGGRIAMPIARGRLLLNPGNKPPSGVKYGVPFAGIRRSTWPQRKPF
jgi:hypothetical protein